MVSAEEKRDFLKQLIDMAAQPDSLAQAEEALYQLLLRDTNSGKLYKFCSFDKKGYALKAVRTGTLHCSKPTIWFRGKPHLITARKMFPKRRLS